VTWPDLSTIKFVSIRSATEVDVNNGSAAFLLQSEGESIGSPMDIDIPQYAIHTNEDTNEKTNVVIIQAEETEDQKVFGALIVENGELMVGLSHEFKMLGQSKPD